MVYRMNYLSVMNWLSKAAWKKRQQKSTNKQSKLTESLLIGHVKLEHYTWVWWVWLLVLCMNERWNVWINQLSFFIEKSWGLQVQLCVCSTTNCNESTTHDDLDSSYFGWLQLIRVTHMIVSELTLGKIEYNMVYLDIFCLMLKYLRLFNNYDQWSSIFQLSHFLPIVPTVTSFQVFVPSRWF